MRANKWLLDLERNFEINGCTEVQKVHLLQEEAGIWWNTKRQLLIRELGNITAPTWDRFKEEFDNCFFPEMTKQQKA